MVLYLHTKRQPRILSENHLTHLKCKIEKRQVGSSLFDSRIWKPVNTLNGPPLFDWESAKEHRSAWRKSPLCDCWDMSPFGVGKWPHMLPAVPNAIRDHKKLIQALDAAQLSRAFSQDQNVNVDPQEDNVNQNASGGQCQIHIVDLDEDGFLD